MQFLRQGEPASELAPAESPALLLSDGEAAPMLAGLGEIVIGELHALAGSKRGDLPARIKGRITQRRRERVSPLAGLVLREIGREAVYGSALDPLLDEAMQAPLAEAGIVPAHAARKSIS